jgi:hypothetical protein
LINFRGNIKMKKILEKILGVFVILITGGCSGIQKMFSPPTGTMDRAIQIIDTPVNSCSPMLGWLGGICTLSGMALLVLTGGRMGWRPLVGGVLFVVLNYALAMYASWFFLPVVIATGAISLAWAGKIVLGIYKEKSNGRSI